MNLRQLRCFTAVVETGRFARAATRLRMAQPGLSLQVATLEREIGVVLLVRNPSGVRPTELGAKLYRSAVRVLEELDRVSADLQAQPDPASSISLGLGTEAAAVLAGPITTAVMAAFPDARLSLAEAASPLLEKRLLDGTLGMAILFGPYAWQGDGEAGPTGDMRRWPLPTQALFHVTAGGTPCPGDGAATAAALAGVRLVLPAFPNAIRIAIDSALEEAGVQPVVAAEADAPDTLLALVRAGYGSTILPYTGMPQPGLHWSAFRDPALALTATFCVGTAAGGLANTIRRAVDEVLGQTQSQRTTSPLCFSSRHIDSCLKRSKNQYWTSGSQDH